MLLPAGSGKQKSEDLAQLDTAKAVVAAGATLSDMRGFCERQPDACAVGGQVAVALGQKAQDGAKTLYEFISEKVTEKNANEKGTAGHRLAPVSSHSQNTLTPSDLGLGCAWSRCRLHRRGVKRRRGARAPDHAHWLTPVFLAAAMPDPVYDQAA